MNQHSLDFAVIGAQKCATSWMYYCLKDHPEICVRPKKPEFDYIGSEQFSSLGEDWFFDQFSRASEKVLGDVSVDYLYDSASAAELRKYMPTPRLVLSLRSPVSRLISSYSWLTRRSVLPDVPIDSWINELPESSNDWCGQLGPDAAQVILRGFYAHQLEVYLKSFDPSEFLILLYEEIAQDPLKCIQRVYTFLDVDSGFLPPNLGNRAKTNSHSPLLLYLEKKSKNRIYSHMLDFAHQRLSSIRQPKAPVSAASIEKLENIFRPQSESLLRLLKQFPDDKCPSPDTITKHWNL